MDRKKILEEIGTAAALPQAIEQLFRRYDFVRFWERVDTDMMRVDLEFVSYDQLEGLSGKVENFIEELQTLVTGLVVRYESDSGKSELAELPESVDSMLQDMYHGGWLPSFSMEGYVVEAALGDAEPEPDDIGDWGISGSV